MIWIIDLQTTVNSSLDILASSESLTDALAVPFWSGSELYNIINLVFSIVGCVVGIWALWLAVVQIGKTREAAEAAREAANATRRQFVHLTNVVSMQRLCGVTREVIVALRNNDKVTAAIRLEDLQSGLSHARVGFGGGDNSQALFQELIIKVAAVHEGTIAKRGSRNSAPALAVSDLISMMSSIQNSIIGVAATEERKLGHSNANF